MYERRKSTDLTRGEYEEGDVLKILCLRNTSKMISNLDLTKQEDIMQSAKKAQYPKYDYFDTPHTYRGFLNLRGVKGKEIKDTLIVYEDDRFELLINVDIDKQDRPTGVEIIYHGRTK
jgi:hypothetical protein